MFLIAQVYNKVMLALSPQFINACQQRLLAKQQQLKERLARLSPHTELGGGGGDTDVDEQVLEVESDMVAEAELELFRQHLDRVAKALKKIELGTYGTDDSGRIIPVERLEVLPEADTAT